MAMSRRSNLIQIFLALVLLFQGLAVAVTPIELEAQAAVAMHETAMAGMPCGGEQSPSCCDADCPDMQSCLLAQFIAAAPIQIVNSVAAMSFSTDLSVRLSLRSPDNPLRPPISLHA